MRLLGRWVTGLFALMAVLAVRLVAGAGWQWSAFGRYFASPSGSFAEAQALDDLIAAENFHTAVTGVMFLASLAVGVVFVVWLFRAARNARRAGATETLHEGWSIGGWFVPVGRSALPYWTSAHFAHDGTKGRHGHSWPSSAPPPQERSIGLAPQPPRLQSR